MASRCWTFPGCCGLAGSLSTATKHEGSGVPDIPGIQLADIAGGALTTAFGIAAALFRREVTGNGDWLDVSMTDSVLPFMVPALAQQATVGNVSPGGETLSRWWAAGLRSHRAAVSGGGAGLGSKGGLRLEPKDRAGPGPQPQPRWLRWCWSLTTP